MTREKLILIRHGESMGNVWSEAYENDSINFLSPLGVKQAEIAGMLLARSKIKIDMTVSSDMTRARHTLSSILHQLDDWKRDYIIKSGLNERHMGMDGESASSHYKRVVNSLEDVFEQWKYGNLLIVSHFYTMMAIFKYLGFDCTKSPISNNIRNAIPFICDPTLSNSLKIIDPYDHTPHY